ncbi:MAG TPA: hypothetical protein VFT98_11995 [Myxococcota bacterium]|nr:hypothetical protein [Myxococcota bacterium]
MTNARLRFATSALIALTTSSGLACHSMGPRTVARSRFDYAAAIGDSWKRLMLLNIVKLRYADPPVFLEVASVIDQYTLEGIVNASGVFPGAIPDEDVFSATAIGRYGNRPTITYQPLYGEHFTRSLLTPVKPASVFSMVQAGWPIDAVFRACVRAMNGINAPGFSVDARPADPRWEPLLAAFRRLQLASALDLRVQREKGAERVLLVIRPGVSEELAADGRFIREALGIQPGLGELELVFGLLPRNDRELAMQTRSMLEVLGELALAIDVPAAHEADGRAAPSSRGSAAPQPGFRIHSSESRPGDAFVAVPYRDHWFWIDDRDFLSKRSFSLLILVGALAESGTPAQLPAVTISTGE